jgi:SPP1 family predicted phage head-tail adaptor
VNKNISVALQSYTATRSSTGAEVRTWTTYATVQAGVKDLRGEAYYAQEQTANQIVMELYIWYRTDVTPKHRAIVGGVTYEIESVINIRMENREMLLRLRRAE